MLVVLAEAAAIAAFYGFQWEWLRTANVACLHAILQGLGCHVQSIGHAMTVEGRAFVADRDCTYVDLILCSLPLLWRVRRSLADNAAVLASFAAVVVVVNLARATLAIYVTARGGSWFWSHDMVDYVLWYPTLGAVGLLWAQSLKTLWLLPNDSGGLPVPSGRSQGETGPWPVPTKADSPVTLLREPEDCNR